MKLDLLNEDCMDVMARYEDNYFDLAIVDPPYGINQSGGKNKTRTKLATSVDYKDFAGGDKEPPNKQYFNELRRVSQNQIIWGANHFADLVGRRSSCWLVWDKDNKGSHFADCELAFTSFNSAVRLFKYTWHGMLQGNMKNKEYRIHPTQKPVKLYDWIYKNYSEPGQKILDTHLGSGSNAIAAHYFGIGQFVGCELDKHYFDKACERIEHETAQIDIFESEQ